MNKAELHMAYFWICDNCGRDNFCRSVSYKPTAEEAAELIEKQQAVSAELTTRLRAAEADRDTYKARAEAAEKVVAKVGDWYHNAESARDITDEGTFRPTEDDENALADAIEAYWTDQAARTTTPKETTR